MKLIKESNMALQKIDIDYVTELSRLALSDEEKKQFGAQMVRILDYVNKLSELNVEGIAPLTQTVEDNLPLREDVTAPSLPVETALKNAPKREAGSFVVPPPIE
jgi:aspartyl-tRNA(Asn)/glutamyl-tRNA(Gln) amidotransferase subunit C